MPPTGAQPQQQRQEFVHPAAQHAKKKGISPFMIEPIKALYIFLIVNIISALFAPIQDCDETFNYWEPTHYLSHGYGLQTWEYSPEYAIRSWSYVGLHAIVGNVRRLLPQTTKLSEFFFIPTVMSAGNFHASTAYLPSSFAMYTTMLGTTAFMNWRGGLKTSLGIWWFAVGGILGWPFASALCAPFLIEEAILAVISYPQGFYEAVRRVGQGVIAALLLLKQAGDTAINAFFYKKTEVVSWNIVRYNIFSSTGGPNLYGTEPWTFYFRNLTINFNIWFILALMSLPLFLIQKIFSSKQHSFQTGMRTIVFLSPFYMWLGIFTMQPHKEERFMYPMYPFVALNAALGFHIILSAFGNPDPKTLVGKIPARLKLFTVLGVLQLSLMLGLARIIGIYTAYSAPLKLYEPLGAGVLGQQGLGGDRDYVCYGKEWYRFPSSYFLPRDMHAKFIRSEFRGLLPGEFSEAQNGFGSWSGTWLPPKGMNDRNEEDMGKYVDIKACNFLVDTQYPERHHALPPNEPNYIADKENWEIVKCEPFLDAANTHLLARVLWIPDLSVVPEKFRRKWGQHCLLQKRNQTEHSILYS
ncbi:hypothetical protein Daesc_000124 [Daldinia eschscholtzii]|uniref:Mannosyltransferase n=1 Tax=Daldinia eschscholtzii TaxID=292717 RepID=A0AAX6MXF1_9PEZI